MKLIGRYAFIHVMLFLTIQLYMDGSELSVFKSYRDVDPCDDDKRITLGVSIGEVYAADSIYLIEFALKYDPGAVQFNALLGNAGLTGKFEEKFVNVYQEDSLIVGNIGTFSSVPRWGDEDLFVLSFNYIGEDLVNAKFELIDLYLGDEYRGWLTDTVSFENFEIIPEIKDDDERYLNLFFEEDQVTIQEKGETIIPLDLDFGNYKNVKDFKLELSSSKEIDMNIINDFNSSYMVKSVSFESELVKVIDVEILEKSSLNEDLAFKISVDSLYDDTLMVSSRIIELNKGACITSFESDSIEVILDKVESSIETEIYNDQISSIEVYDLYGRLIFEGKNETNWVSGRGQFIIRYSYRDGRQFIKKKIID